MHGNSYIGAGKKQSCGVVIQLFYENLGRRRGRFAGELSVSVIKWSARAEKRPWHWKRI